MKFTATWILRAFACFKAPLWLLALVCMVGCSAQAPGDGTDNGEQQSQRLTALQRINCGGPAVSPFSADQFATDGSTWTSSTPVSTSRVANAAPASVYQSERYGNFKYTIGSLTAGASLTVRLHFAETHWTSAGQRQFNVIINGVQVLTNFDVYALVGSNNALVRDFSTTASSSGEIVIQFVSVVDNSRISGIEILAPDASGNQPPSVATAASANPNPTNGTSTALSTLGADDGGESNLTYTWATVGTPPAPVTFSANSSNAAKNTTASFTKAGSYTLGVTIRDAGGATASSNVSVVVNQKLSSISVTPTGAQVPAGGTQQFAATAQDQFGSSLTTQPSFSWTTSGGGSVSSSGLYTAGSSAGTFSVTASSSGVSGSASLTIGSAPPPTGSAAYRINCGGPAVGSFSADQLFSGGSTWNDNISVSTSGVANAAPAAVYQTERWGNQTYTLPNLVPNASYVVRLHFAETKFNQAGSRVFNVLVNGAQVLTNFDIFASAGYAKALVRDFNANATSSGTISIQYVTVKDNAKSDGIEILSTGGGTNNQPPTVATSAAASPNPASGTSTALSVLGADDGGEAALSYTWATTGTPPAAVTFSANGSNAAKNTTASFSKAGSYALNVTITDAGGASVTSSVTVAVNQSLTSIGVTPTTAQVATGGTQQFFATARDQFGDALSTQPGMSWTTTGGGSVSSTGLFTAGSSSGGPFSVSASSGGKTGSASVTVTSSPSPVSYQTDFGLTESPLSEGGVWHNNGLDWTRVVTSGGLAYGTQDGHNGAPYDDSYAILSGFPPDQYAEATIHIEPGITAQYQEVEILLRWSDSPRNSIGYECNLAFNGQYGTIGRWPGPIGTDVSQYTTLCPETASPWGPPQEGDILSAQIVGYTITSWVTRGGVRRQLCTGTDNTPGRLATGNPGIGFYAAGAPANSKFAFTSFSARSL